MLDRQQHEAQLKKLLVKITGNYDVNTQLVFKGGTCLYIFYQLPRFSVDLDFNVREEGKFNPENMTALLEKSVNIEDYKEKRFTWCWVCSYEKGKQKIKVEVNKRVFPDKILVKQLYGLSLNTLAPESLFAHKLCAIIDRPTLYNRDLYDAWFMFEKNFRIDENIIQLRMNQGLGQYLDTLQEFIQEKVNPHRIWNGIGELLFHIQLRKESVSKK